MPALDVLAYAKLNLSLDVLEKRPDGYHEMRMVMQTVDLCDRLRLEIGTGKPLSMRSNLGFLPADGRNLAAAAALRLAEDTGADWGGLSITLDKTIPVCAGLAGGSADAAAVLRVFTNLIRNAMEHGRSRMSILLYQEGDEVVSVFANDAPGLTPEDVEHVFDRFFTADKMRTGQSTGLGLAIVKALVERMGHTVSAELEGDLFRVVVRWQTAKQ